MEEGNGKSEEVVNQNSRDEIFSQSVRAGKRTYFFDVKSTRREDLYLTITESKKRFNRDGKSFYEKHKIFLYKEDFEKFINGLNTAIDYIKENNPHMNEVFTPRDEHSEEEETEMAENFTNVEFEDLGDKNS